MLGPPNIAGGMCWFVSVPGGAGDWVTGTTAAGAWPVGVPRVVTTILLLTAICWVSAVGSPDSLGRSGSIAYNPPLCLLNGYSVRC
eukprot:scaffold225043_cov31-Attheya_sp.AAC.1